jgi:HD-GYP domain-containing protein (c-di-GMP phosphodiesterase class II)
MYYLLVAALGISLEHYLIDALLGPNLYWTKFTVDTALRLGIAFALFVFASRLIKSQEAARDQSTTATLELLERLALASEFRDDVTAAHNSRIGQYAVLVGQELGLCAEQCEILRYAASLHDIGKVAIPDHVLQKPGPLTAEERALMQKHVLYGADLLLGGRHPMMDAAYNVALTHHEAWNGRGYPNGLSGPQIPLCGRIIALCDTFDALLSARPYKEAWPIDDAVIEILRLSGKRFDPIVVSAFYRALPKIKELEKQPHPKKSIRESVYYLPVEPVVRLDASNWYPEPVKQAQEANEAALGKLLLSDSEIRA